MNELVTFEQAKKLKELGFKEECFYSYYEEKLQIPTIDYTLESHNSYENPYWVDAPFLYQVQKWIYENHKLYVDAVHAAKDAFIICITNVYGTVKYISADSEWFTSPSEALSAGIDKALELL